MAHVPIAGLLLLRDHQRLALSCNTLGAFHCSSGETICAAKRPIGWPRRKGKCQCLSAFRGASARLRRLRLRSHWLPGGQLLAKRVGEWRKRSRHQWETIGQWRKKKKKKDLDRKWPNDCPCVWCPIIWLHFRLFWLPKELLQKKEAEQRSFTEVPLKRATQKRAQRKQSFPADRKQCRAQLLVLLFLLLLLAQRLGLAFGQDLDLSSSLTAIICANTRQ